MVGIVILSHGSLAQSMLESAHMLVGEGEQFAVEGIFAQDNPDDYRQRVREAVQSVDTGEGTLALVDLFGGTPFNTAVRLSREMNIHVVAGMNISMVLYTLLERAEGMTLDEVAAGVQRAGREGITDYVCKDKGDKKDKTAC